MTEQERINTELQTRLAVHDEKFNALIQSLADFKEESRREMKDFKDEMKDFKNEMRDRDNQRHAEIAEIRASISSMGKHVRNMTIAVAVGVGAMVVAILLK